MAAWKDALRGTPVESLYRYGRDRIWRSSRAYDAVLTRRRRRIVAAWEAAGRHGTPPPEVKQSIVLAEARRAGLSTLVETGTYLGATVQAARRRFERIVSVEIDEALAARARAYFAPFANVTILQGDSGRLVAEVAAGLDRPALWWLDGHYSGPGTGRGDEDTPIRAEVEVVLRHPVRGHVVLIDDARLFTGAHGYPTLDELRVLVEERFDLIVADDVIRLRERSAGGAPNGRA